jgi:farnesyl-diphosphate farnesyltransferase
MAAGMADYAQMTNDGGGSICLATIADYNLYGHYVGGLMGAGLLRTFFALEGEGPCTPLQLELSDCWGRCSADFIRDYREDVEEERYLWPKEIWSKEQYGFGSMQEMYEAVEADEAGEKAKKALYVQSEMVLEALRHASDSLDFLRLLKKPNVLHFASKLLCANFAKLEVCFMNKEVFRGDVKVRKAEAAKVSTITCVPSSFISPFEI